MEENAYSKERETHPGANNNISACLDDIPTGTCTTADTMLTCAEEILLPDIDLYLECIDDAQYVIPERFNLASHALIGQNVQWKISFPAGQISTQDKPVPGLSCAECTKVFRKENLLKQHLISKHGMSVTFTCNSCDFSTNSNRNVLRHIRRAHHKKTSSKAPADVNQLASMSREIKISEISTPLYQNKCHELTKAESFKDKDGFKPLVIKSGNQGHVIQGSSNFKSVDLDITTSSEAGGCPFEKLDLDDRCGQTFPASRVIAPQMTEAMHNQHKSDICFKCNECEFSCVGKGKSLLNEQKIQVLCSVCSKLIVSMDTYCKHEAGIPHGIVPKMKGCPYANCEDRVKLNRDLNEHMPPVDSTTTYKCDVSDCNKSFRSARQLRRHKVFHTGIHKCSWEGCGKSFRDKYNLQTHYSTHTGCKARQCPHCPYSCVQKSSMNWHRKKKHPDVKERPLHITDDSSSTIQTVHVEIIKRS